MIVAREAMKGEREAEGSEREGRRQKTEGIKDGAGGRELSGKEKKKSRVI